MSAPPPRSTVAPPYAAGSYFSSISSIITVIIIIASAAIVSASTYLLLRFLSNRFHRSFSVADDVVSRRGSYSTQTLCHVASRGSLDSLPLFDFRFVTGSVAGGDCAVCLSRFQQYDLLRLLPVCCHAFHADCIDKWIIANRTCPLCRSAVFPCVSDALDKILRRAGNCASSNVNGRSFRIEIGSISRIRGGARRSYSVGSSFEYVVDNNGCEVPVGCTSHHIGDSGSTSSEKLEIPMPDLPLDALAAEVSGQRNWLTEYLTRLPSMSISSRAMSFRSSRRFFTGSSCRSEATVAADELEANQTGEQFDQLCVI